MIVKVTREMIDEAISAVNSKLAIGAQKVKVYSPAAGKAQYYINNIVGELGELAFAKAVKSRGRKLGVEPHLFGPFRNSDTCDFFTSKTAKSIDVKTTYRSYGGNLLISQSIALWRPVYAYVLVELLPTRKGFHTTDSIYEINEAHILGSQTFEAVTKRDKNLRDLYGKKVYSVDRRRLSPIDQLIDGHHFYKSDEVVSRYYSTGKLELDIASIEHGAIVRSEGNSYNKDINELAEEYRKSGITDGSHNFKPVFLNENKIVSFSIDRGKLHTSLFLTALLEAEVQARKLELTLVLPSHIEVYIPKEDKAKVVEIIEQLKCNVEYIWSHNKSYEALKKQKEKPRDLNGVSSDDLPFD